MKTILNIQSFLQNLSKVIISVIRILLLSKPNKYIKKEKKEKDVVLLGNGPSLEKMIVDFSNFLTDKDLISVNHFPTTKYFKILKPKYYITIAPDLWNDIAVEPFRSRSDHLFKTIAQDTNWDLIMYMPYIARKHKIWQKEIVKNEKIQIKYINVTAVEGWNFFKYFFFKRNIGMPRPHNIMIPSIFTAINTGYQNIYLWGTDHSWLPDISVNEDNVALINEKHFYDFDTSVSKTLHMDKEGRVPRKLHEILMKFMLAFKGYFTINDYAEKCRVNIYNATKDSFIDAFNRIKLSNKDN